MPRGLRLDAEGALHYITQSVLGGMEWGERIFKRGDGVLKILLKNGNIGATSRPSYTNNTQKRVLSAPGKAWRIQLVEKPA
jgi:hypothetical protein